MKQLLLSEVPAEVCSVLKCFFVHSNTQHEVLVRGFVTAFLSVIFFKDVLP